MYFFVHIPKTAGTSFRKAAEVYLGKDKLAYDYGPESLITSRAVQKHLYSLEIEDRAGLYKHWLNERVSFVSGHMPVARFVDRTGVSGIITFLREPLKRAYSEFLHLRRNDGYKGSFRDFFMCQRPNHQSHMLSGLPLQALGFVGITERYEHSLRLINHQFGWDLRKRRDNRAGLIQTWFGKISPDDESEFYQRNPLDLALFREANWWLDQRLCLFEEGKPFAHATVDGMLGGLIRGWAFWAKDSDESVVIEVHRDGVKVAEAVADRDHAHLASHGAPRAGRVGFEVAVGPMPASELSVVVAQTGQIISAPAACRV